MKKPNITADSVEAYLLANIDFAKEWFSRNNVKKQTADELGGGNDDIEKMLQPPEVADTSKSTNSITCKMFEEIVTRKATECAKEKNLADMDERDRMMELIRDVANELDVDILCKKIMQNVSILTNSDRESLFLARGTADNRYLECKLLDVTKTTTMDIKVPFGKGIAGHVAATKNTINIKNAYEDSRFNKDIDRKTGYRTHSILCMPILNYNGDVIGVAQLINKKSDNHEFTSQDENVFRNYLTFCGIGLTNAQLYEMSVKEYNRNQLLLNLATGIFSQQRSLEKLIRKIMIESQELIKCERSTVYLVNENVENSVEFSLACNLYSKDKSLRMPSTEDLRTSKPAQIAKTVASSKKSIIVTDAENDPLFDGDVIDYDDVEIKTMACLPVFNLKRKIVGIVQFVNNLSQTQFTEKDLSLVNAFAIFCGLGISNTHMYEQVCVLTAKRIVNMGLISYHATVQDHDYVEIPEHEVPSAKSLELYTYEFNDMLLSEDETVKAAIRMFLEINVGDKFQVPYKVLCRWVSSVRKNYRPVTYHNWRHGFNVAQSMFTMLHTGNMKDYMDDLEVFGLLVACLCHDLDHRGTNNAFQVKSSSPLGVLYGASTMEHHHFDQCMLILKCEGNCIFDTLSKADYDRVVELIENAILATDLALYFKKRGVFQTHVESGETKWKDQEKKELLIGVMMTSCDVAAITKPWPVQREVGKLVATEFFEQGDMERSLFEQEPIPMMDRNKKRELPKMQVGFIDFICMPIYKIMGGAFPGTKPLLDGCINNRNEWQALADQPEVDVWQ